MVEGIPKDRAGGNQTTQHYSIEYINNIKNNNMIDIWRKQNPPKKRIYLRILNQGLTGFI